MKNSDFSVTTALKEGGCPFFEKHPPDLTVVAVSIAARWLFSDNYQRTQALAVVLPTVTSTTPAGTGMRVR